MSKVSRYVSVSRKRAIEIILDTYNTGTYFTVEFIKRTPPHDRRVLNGRLNVNKYESGVGLAFDPFSKNLIPVHEAGKEDDGYRFIPHEGIIWVRHSDTQYNIKD